MLRFTPSPMPRATSPRPAEPTAAPRTTAPTSTARRIAAAAALAAVAAAAPSTAAAARVVAPTLTARSTLPATLFLPGPTSGAALGTTPVNGVTPPFAGQPIPGFSGILRRNDGT